METRSMTKHERDERLESVQQRPAVVPRVDIFENQDELLLIADLPGVSDKGLTIHLEKDQLSLDARPDDEQSGSVLGREYRLVDYRRSFLVPSGIDRERIAADLKNGVLRLRLPKAEAVKPRKIEVRAG